MLYETAYLPAGAIVILLPPARLHYEELGLASQGGAVLVVEPPYLGKIYIMGRMRMHCIFYYYHIVLCIPEYVLLCINKVAVRRHNLAVFSAMAQDTHNYQQGSQNMTLRIIV